MAGGIHSSSVRAGALPPDEWAGGGGEARRRAAGMRAVGGIVVRRSPLSRKIIVFNVVALLSLAVGVIALDPFRASLLLQREMGLVTEAELVADVFEAQLEREPGSRLGQEIDPAAILAGLDLPEASVAFVFDLDRNLLATTRGRGRSAGDAGFEPHRGVTLITGILDAIRAGLDPLLGAAPPPDPAETQRLADQLVARSLRGGTHVETNLVGDGGTIFAVATPIRRGSDVAGAVAMTSGAGEIDALVHAKREQVMQVVVAAVIVSIMLSHVLAATIVNPLSELAAAAELRGDRARSARPERVRIPDLSDRTDEIGRLSTALGGMVAALYDRIDANEQFAADVAHEIKNPLASLGSAIGSLRRATRPEQCATLLDVIEHDVRRLDRLVSDISNASRLDSELVREDEKPFDLVAMLARLAGHLSVAAQEKGIEVILDLPPEPIVIEGLESRLAQVVVNLIANATSFCGEGDAIRIWVRRRRNRILVVVEDTGPGIPEAALGKIFERFYSERPAGQFGHNSGLGLAISKQIVEAHGGVIWAENIVPTRADPTSEPLGARFVVGLPA